MVERSDLDKQRAEYVRQAMSALYDFNDDRALATGKVEALFQEWGEKHREAGWTEALAHMRRYVDGLIGPSR